MALPASGPISFNAINIELGLSGTATKSINDANYRTLAGVPSGTIDLQDFYGKSNIIFGLEDDTVSLVDFEPASIVVTYLLGSNGVIAAEGGASNLSNWVTPTTVAGDYQVRATLVSGDITGTSDVLNTWLALTSDRKWRSSRNTVGVTTAQLTIEIRDTATSTIRDTATIVLYAEVIAV